MPCNALCDAAASPDVLIRRERVEPIEEEDEEDGEKRGGESRDGEGKKEKERDREGGLASPMGARSFFVMIVILEPDQPRASGPAGRLDCYSARFLTRPAAVAPVDTRL